MRNPQCAVRNSHQSLHHPIPIRHAAAPPFASLLYQLRHPQPPLHTHAHKHTHTHSLSLSCLFSSQSRTKIQRRKTKTKATNGQSHSAQTHVCTPMHELGCAPRVVNTSAQRAGRVGNAVLLFRLCSHDSTSRTVARPSARRAAALCPPLCTRAVDA